MLEGVDGIKKQLLSKVEKNSKYCLSLHIMHYSSKLLFPVDAMQFQYTASQNALFEIQIKGVDAFTVQYCCYLLA